MQDKIKELREKRKKSEEDKKRKADAEKQRDHIAMEMTEDEEKKAKARKAKQDDDEASKQIQEDMKVFEDVKSGINVIRRNVQLIDGLKMQSNKTFDQKVFQEIMRKLDTVMNESKSNAAAVKSALKAIDEENSSFSDGATKQMRINMVQTYTKTFAETMKEYSEASSSFQTSLKERIKRQAEIIKPDVNQAELEKIEQDPQAFFSQAMLSGQMIDVLSDIEQKHSKILEIERSVHYINELFHDLATLVNLQQEHLDLIETNVNQTKAYTDDGKKDLEAAQEYNKSSRTTQCCIIVIFIIILCAVLFPTLKAKGQI